MQTNQAAYAALTADAPGVITAVYADVGAVVGAGTPVVSLAHDGPRDVVFAVPEDQLPVFRKLQGQAGGVSVTLWGGNATIPATIREVAAAADPASRTFQVKADVPAGAAELGQTATVHVELAPADGKLRLPLQAVAGQRQPELRLGAGQGDDEGARAAGRRAAPRGRQPGAGQRPQDRRHGRDRRRARADAGPAGDPVRRTDEALRRP